jgi:hypothetical protein
VWIGEDLKKSFHINNWNNVSSNLFQNISSGLADDTIKNPQWQQCALGLNESKTDLGLF